MVKEFSGVVRLAYHSAKRLAQSFLLVSMALAMCIILAACESTSELSLPSVGNPLQNLSLSGGSDTGASGSSGVTGSRFPSVAIALAPVLGAPPRVAKELNKEITAQAGKHDLTIVKAGTKAPYTLRGYLAASPNNSGTVLAYIWDVTDAKGKRVHRILGEESIKGKKGKDPWTLINSEAIRQIADKTAQKVSDWAPKEGVSQSRRTASATTPSSDAASASASKKPAKKPVRTASIEPTGSITRASNRTVVAVPRVTNAPGDGIRALTAAMRQQLRKSGIDVVSRPSSSTYTVRGNVKMGKPSGGQQKVAIDWVVKDPKGKELGTINQRNTITAGALDGPWGNTAELASAAAAANIVKLLPKRR